MRSLGSTENVNEGEMPTAASAREDRPTKEGESKDEMSSV